MLYSSCYLLAPGHCEGCEPSEPATAVHKHFTLHQNCWWREILIEWGTCTVVHAVQTRGPGRTAERDCQQHGRARAQAKPSFLHGSSAPRSLALSATGQRVCLQESRSPVRFPVATATISRDQPISNVAIAALTIICISRARGRRACRRASHAARTPARCMPRAARARSQAADGDERGRAGAGDLERHFARCKSVCAQVRACGASACARVVVPPTYIGISTPLRTRAASTAWYRMALGAMVDRIRASEPRLPR